MFKIDDMIVYGNGGVCRVVGIGVPDFLKTKEEYYQLESISNNRDTIYVNTKNQKMPIRPLITREDAEQYIQNFSEVPTIYNTDDKVRDREFTENIKGCDCEVLLGMLKGINEQRKKKLEKGKHLGQMDERNLNKISKIIYTEFSVALEVPVEEAEKLINNCIG